MSLDLDLVYSSLALDANLSPCWVSCTYQAADGTPMSGTVSFTPAPKWIADPDIGTVIYPTPVTVTLDDDGSFSQELIASDDTDANPNGWTYTVTEVLTNNGVTYTNQYSIEAPSNAYINLADEIPVNDYTGTPVVRGRPGPTGMVTWTGSHLTGTGPTITAHSDTSVMATGTLTSGQYLLTASVLLTASAVGNLTFRAIAGTAAVTFEGPATAQQSLISTGSQNKSLTISCIATVISAGTVVFNVLCDVTCTVETTETVSSNGLACGWMAVKIA